MKDPHGIIIILFNNNQYLWYQKLYRSIQLSIKKLYCQTNLVDGSLFMFPENYDNSIPTSSMSYFSYDNINDQQCYRPSCGFCCDCSDSIGLELIYKRIILLPKMSRDEYLSTLPFV